MDSIHKKAMKKYYEKNKDNILQQQREKYAIDEKYKQYQLDKARRWLLQKKPKCDFPIKFSEGKITVSFD